MCPDARRVLLEGLVDDAGLFPPARKTMSSAVLDHAAALAGPVPWVVGRFLCPASRLEEAARRADPAWSLGVVFDDPSDDWLEATRAGLERVRACARRPDVHALEARLPDGGVDSGTLEEFARLAHAVRPGMLAFLEVQATRTREVEAALDVIASVRSPLALGAKLRCGGPEPGAFPAAPVVAAFITRARRLGLRFKATAGLHHPFRERDEELGVLQHGFINLLAATALPTAETVRVVEERDRDAFRIAATGIAWRDHWADVCALVRARQLFTSFGSCSLDIPVRDVAAEALLPAGAAA